MDQLFLLLYGSVSQATPESPKQRPWGRIGPSELSEAKAGHKELQSRFIGDGAHQ